MRALIVHLVAFLSETSFFALSAYSDSNLLFAVQTSSELISSECRVKPEAVGLASQALLEQGLMQGGAEHEPIMVKLVAKGFTESKAMGNLILFLGLFEYIENLRNKTIHPLSEDPSTWIVVGYGWGRWPHQSRSSRTG